MLWRSLQPPAKKTKEVFVFEEDSPSNFQTSVDVSLPYQNMCLPGLPNGFGRLINFYRIIHFRDQDLAVVRTDNPPSRGTVEAVGNDEVAASVKLTMKALKEYLGLKSGSEREKLQFIGSEFGRIVSRGMAPSDSIEEVLEGIRVFWTGHGLGEMEVIRGTPLTFTIRNCYDCIGAQAGDTLCGFKEGFINAVFTEKVAAQATVEEIECCGTGASSCRFTVTPVRQ